MPPCLSNFSSAWSDLQASPEIMNIVKFGHKIIFDVNPKLTKPQNKFRTILPEEQMVVIRNEINLMLKKGVIRIVSKSVANKKLGVYSRMFCVPKPGVDQWRPIINLKPLNKYINKEKFRMDTLKDVRSVLQPGHYGATVDLTDAYFHIRIHKDSRKYLRFIFE